MFGFGKGKSTKRLRKQLIALQEKSMQAQRKGDIRLHSELSAEADQLWQKIQQLEGQAES